MNPFYFGPLIASGAPFDCLGVLTLVFVALKFFEVANMMLQAGINRLHIIFFYNFFEFKKERSCVKHFLGSKYLPVRAWTFSTFRWFIVIDGN